MAFKVVIIRAEMFSDMSREDSSGLDFQRFTKVLSDLCHCDVKVIIATTIHSAITSLDLRDERDNLFHEGVIAGHTTEEMIRGILAKHKDVALQDIMYVDKINTHIQEAARTGIATCAKIPVGTPAIFFEDNPPVGAWSIHHLGQLPLIVAAQC